MTKTPELLGEKDARELLHSFVQAASMVGEATSYGDFSKIVDGSQLTLAVASLVAHHGIPNPRDPNQVRIDAKNNGWKFSAYNTTNEDYGGSTISRTHRIFGIGPRERSLVEFPHTTAIEPMALEETTKSDQTCLVAECSPTFLEGYRDSNVFGHSYSRDGEPAWEFKPLAVLAAEARLNAPKTLNGFLRISSQLVNTLLEVTSKTA